MDKNLGTQRKLGFFAKAGQIVDEYWPVLLVSVSGAVAMTPLFGKLFIQTEGWRKTACPLLGLLLVLGFIVGSILLYYRGGRIMQLKNENEDLKNLLQGFGDDVFEAWEVYLGHLSQSLGFGDSDRISIYKFLKEEEQFLMLGRYSEQPEFKKKGRGIYPANEGCIGRAWLKGEALAADFPDSTNRFHDYLALMKKDWGIKEEVVKTFKMKSRSIAAFSLMDRAELNRIAVIVFESIEPNAFESDKLRIMLQGREGKKLSHLCEVLAPLNPTPSIALERGF